MRIAFDLDGTLVPKPGSVMPVERCGLVARAVSREPIRKGAPGLLRSLRHRGHEVWLYTTSFRSPARIIDGWPVNPIVSPSPRHRLRLYRVLTRPNSRAR